MENSFDIARDILEEIDSISEECCDNGDNSCTISFPLYKGAYDLLTAAKVLIDLYSMLDDSQYYITSDGLLVIEFE